LIAVAGPALAGKSTPRARNHQQLNLGAGAAGQEHDAADRGRRTGREYEIAGCGPEAAATTPIEARPQPGRAKPPRDTSLGNAGPPMPRGPQGQ